MQRLVEQDPDAHYRRKVPPSFRQSFDRDQYIPSFIGRSVRGRLQVWNDCAEFGCRGPRYCSRCRKPTGIPPRKRVSVLSSKFMLNSCAVPTTDMTAEYWRQKSLPLSLYMRHELDEVQHLVFKEPLVMSSREWLRCQKRSEIQCVHTSTDKSFAKPIKMRRTWDLYRDSKLRDEVAVQRISEATVKVRRLFDQSYVGAVSRIDKVCNSDSKLSTGLPLSCGPSFLSTK
jgi:hypothetical protein